MKTLVPGIALILTALNIAAFEVSNAADAAIEPAGIYQTIDVRLADDTIKALHDYKGEARGKIINTILAKPENFAPPVLYVLSSVLFNDDKKDEAAFWFYAGQLRGRIDANICADKTARSAIAEMNQRLGPRINEYAFKDIAKLTNTVERVLAWEEQTPCNYDRRWINLHGLAAVDGETNAPLSAPKEQWEAIRKRTRDEYRSEFHKEIAEFNQRKH
jgi:hypothetical protein